MSATQPHPDEPVPLPPAIGTRLLACRQRLGMTQQQTADAIKLERDTQGRTRELTRAAYAQWELGLTTPDVERIRAAARVFGVSPSHLAFGEPDDSQTDSEAIWIRECGADLIDGSASRWAVPRSELERLQKGSEQLRVIRIPHDVAGSPLVRGLPAVVDWSVRSVDEPGIYAFTHRGRLDIAAMALRPSSDGSTVVIRSGATTFDEMAEALDVRGRVVSAWVDLR